MSLSPPPSREKLPVVNGQAEMPRAWLKWFTDLAAQVTTSVSTTWDSISKIGSNLSDIETRNHSALQNLNTADHAHLYLADRDELVAGDDSTLHYHASDRDSANFTGTNWTDLTDAGATTLHKHDHNGQDGKQGGTADEYFHLTSAQHTDLTDGGDTTLHAHDIYVLKTSVVFPFYDSTGTLDTISLNTDGTFPFYNSSGVADNIPLVT